MFSRKLYNWCSADEDFYNPVTELLGIYKQVGIKQSVNGHQIVPESVQEDADENAPCRWYW